MSVGKKLSGHVFKEQKVKMMRVITRREEREKRVGWKGSRRGWFCVVVYGGRRQKPLLLHLSSVVPKVP